MEYERKGEFVRIYPSPGGEVYEPFFQHQKQIQRFIHLFLFDNKTFPIKASSKPVTPVMPNLEKYSRLKEEKKELSTEPQNESKVVITGDDVLIEYVK